MGCDSICQLFLNKMNICMHWISQLGQELGSLGHLIKGIHIVYSLYRIKEKEQKYRMH
jgi:hypothetical protein